MTEVQHFPTPPRGAPANHQSPVVSRELALKHRTSSMTNPKALIIPRELLAAVLRSETESRKELVEAEAAARQDASFLIAVSRTKYRELAQSPERQRYTPHKPTDPSSKRDDTAAVVLSETAGSPTKEPSSTGVVMLAPTEDDDETTRVDKDVNIQLFWPEAPKRGVPMHSGPELRPAVLANRKASTQMLKVQNEEAELRRWLERLEQKLREPIQSECIDTYLALTGPQRLEMEEEPPLRHAIVAEEEQDLRGIARHAKRERPPFNKPPPPPPTFEQTEEIARAAIEAAELKGRIECHDFLVLRYGVRLFSVNRVESVYRYEMEEKEEAEHAKLIRDYYATHYRCPLLAMMAHTAKPTKNVDLLTPTDTATKPQEEEAPKEEEKSEKVEDESVPAEEEKPAEKVEQSPKEPETTSTTTATPKVTLRIIRCNGLVDEDPFGGNDPFVVVSRCKKGAEEEEEVEELYRTTVKEDGGSTAQWANASVELPTSLVEEKLSPEASEATKFLLTVWDKDVSSDDVIGSVEVETIPATSGEVRYNVAKDGEKAGTLLVEYVVEPEPTEEKPAPVADPSQEEEEQKKEEEKEEHTEEAKGKKEVEKKTKDAFARTPLLHSLALLTAMTTYSPPAQKQ